MIYRSWTAFALIFLCVQVAAAQVVDAECARVVLRVIAAAKAACTALGDEQVCYGDAASLDGDGITFDTAGDTAPISKMRSLQTNTLSVNQAVLGVAYVNTQGASLVLVGETKLTLAPNGTDFFLQTRAKPVGCDAAFDGLLAQGDEAIFAINNVHMTLNGTIVIQAIANDSMIIRAVSGQVDVTAQTTPIQLQAGQETRVELTDLSAAEPPTLAEDFDPTLTENVPFFLLPDHLDVISTQNWVNTGYLLEAGQPFTLLAGGLVSGDCQGQTDCNSFFQPSSVAANCRLNCPLLGVPYIYLLGRVGSGRPFQIGSGGTFTPTTGGTLELGINDNYFGDNAGRFTALVTAPEVSAEVCFVITANRVITRQEADVNSGTSGELMPNISAQADGQGYDALGRRWWRLVGGGWLLDDVTNEGETCIMLPTI